jgi:succinate dehydrogenase/fumarate reductase flavoprotein subunit
MAGLVAAARARELGAAPAVYEKGTRAGGSMLLSSGFVWRYRSVEIHLDQCPGADEPLVRTIVEQFDDALDWLESTGVELLTRETGNPLTTGARFDPKQLVATLARDVLLRETTSEPAILATGGFAARLARTREVLLRANPWSDGDGLDLAVGRGAATAGNMEEFYGRNMPDVDGLAEQDFVTASQLYAQYALVVDEQGREFLQAPVSWHESEVAQATARQPTRRAWYLLTEKALRQQVRERTVSDMVAAAKPVPAEQLPFPVPHSIVLGVPVRAAVTSTIGGLRIDERARVLDERGAPLDGLHAAGVDAGGWATGGWASGLGAALVFGRIAAESALDQAA